MNMDIYQLCRLMFGLSFENGHLKRGDEDDKISFNFYGNNPEQVEGNLYYAKKLFKNDTIEMPTSGWLRVACLWKTKKDLVGILERLSFARRYVIFDEVSISSNNFKRLREHFKEIYFKEAYKYTGLIFSENTEIHFSIGIKKLNITVSNTDVTLDRLSSEAFDDFIYKIQVQKLVEPIRKVYIPVENAGYMEAVMKLLVEYGEGLVDFKK